MEVIWEVPMTATFKAWSHLIGCVAALERCSDGQFLILAAGFYRDAILAP